MEREKEVDARVQLRHDDASKMMRLPKRILERA